jgi:HD superfamily phosphodiesterase
MEVTERVRELVKPQYDTLECWVHSWPHIERVSSNADTIANMEGLDPTYCVISAYCHDLGRIEEEERRRRGDLPLPHGLLSIEPTVDVLKRVGISGVNFNEVIEAVAVHSYRIYEGKNNVAKVLQDADKMNGFGPYGIIGAVKYFGGKDYISPEEIQANRNNREKLIELCNKSLGQAELPVLEKTAKGLGFVLEWYDMLHTKSAKKLIKEEYEYTVGVYQNLIRTLT